MMSNNPAEYGSASEWLAALKKDELWQLQLKQLQAPSADRQALRKAALRKIGQTLTFEFWDSYGHRVEPVVNEVWQMAELTLAKLKMQTIGMLTIEWLEQQEQQEAAAAESSKQQQREADGGMQASARREILERLQRLADKGDWVKACVGEQVKAMLETILGYGPTPLSGEEGRLSQLLWRLLENGRGDRVKIVWQNMVGYLADRRLLMMKGSPALNKDFFGTEENYTNIDKGRPSRDNMSAGFRDVLPLLNAHVPSVSQA